jgi:hypothetical protein
MSDDKVASGTPSSDVEDSLDVVKTSPNSRQTSAAKEAKQKQAGADELFQNMSTLCEMVKKDSKLFYTRMFTPIRSLFTHAAAHPDKYTVGPEASAVRATSNSPSEQPELTAGFVKGLSIQFTMAEAAMNTSMKKQTLTIMVDGRRGEKEAALSCCWHHNVRAHFANHQQRARTWWSFPQ